MRRKGQWWHVLFDHAMRIRRHRLGRLMGRIANGQRSWERRGHGWPALWRVGRTHHGWRGSRVQDLGAIHGHGRVRIGLSSRRRRACIGLRLLLRLRVFQNVIGQLAFLLPESLGVNIIILAGSRRWSLRRRSSSSSRRSRFTCSGLGRLIAIFRLCLRLCLAVRIASLALSALVWRLLVIVSGAMHKAARIEGLLEFTEFLVRQMRHSGASSLCCCL